MATAGEATEVSLDDASSDASDSTLTAPPSCDGPPAANRSTNSVSQRAVNATSVGPIRDPGRLRALVTRIPALAVKNRDVITTVAASFGVFALFALQGVFMARLLGPEKRAEYGTAVLYTQALTYVGLVGTLLVIAGHAARHLDALRNLRRAAIGLGVVTGVATAIVVALLALVALPASKAFLAPLCIVCALTLPLDHIRLALLAVDHGAGAFAKYNRNLLVNAAILPALLALFWLAGIRSIETVVAATLAIPLLSLVYRFRSEGFGKIIGPRMDPPVGQLLAKGLPYAAAQTSHDLFNRLDAVLILWLATLKEQGLYTAAVAAAGLMVVAPNALALFSFRLGARARTDSALTVGRTIAGGLAVLVVQGAMLVGLLVVIEPLIVIVFGQSFHGAVPYARMLLPAQAVTGLTFVAGGYLRGRRKPLVEVWSRILGSAVIVSVALALRSSWHEMGVPIAAICGHTTCAVILAWAVLCDVRRQSAVRPDSPQAVVP